MKLITFMKVIHDHKEKRLQLRQVPRAPQTPRFHGTPSGSATGRPSSKTPTTCFQQPVSDVRPPSGRQTTPSSSAENTRNWRSTPLFQRGRVAFQGAANEDAS
ncbi:hypothetical protein AAFF_G00286220 [Aldrovandia affinis]|uniref:Uncharacterized protein n=1 Tax=Aldrovandia affinis TaxID=143900 RepID=A0AAD7TAJ7_9TELE|nr:hypothetical protein AAFF_G00286220 [Aldrovandia affinis]